MKINIARFYRQERLKLECEIVTPMFLGNARQEAELRSAPFKGLLRYWWRVANGNRFENFEQMLEAENKIFGSANSSTGGKSHVRIAVSSKKGITPQKMPLPKLGKIKHPECERSGGKTDPLGYLAGMGLIHHKKGILHSYFPVGATFTCCLTAPENTIDEIKTSINMWSMFGSVGSRSRNAWGSFRFSWEERALPDVSDENVAYEKDYPNCLGKDDKGHLCWKVKKIENKWENAMKDLAEIYINTRLQFPFSGGEPHKAQQDRHLLGYPVTNHCVEKEHWGKRNNRGKCSPTRHASALRLFVRKEENGFRGYILHLPHRFSSRMWPNETDRQMKIWKQVHKNLDSLCERVRYEEVA